MVDLATTPEKVATTLIWSTLSLLQDQKSKVVMASVMAIECQHLATLRAVAALLAGGAPELIAVPFPAADIPKLPAAAGSVAFPNALEQIMPELIADPTSGAVK